MIDDIKYILEEYGLYLLIAVVLIGSLIFVYSHEVNEVGVVTSKWVETHCSGGEDGSCSQAYMIQLENGNVYSLWWGTRDFDPIQPGMTIEVQARGYHARLWGWRISYPTIFSWQPINTTE